MPKRNPTPDEVYGARFNARMTQRAAAELIGATRRAWQTWESTGNDHRNMPWAKYELFLRLTERKNVQR